MPSLLAECEKYFHCSNLYDVLGVQKDCKPAELRKAFYKSSLLHHPDRQTEESKAKATRQFQILSKVYSILSDAEKRCVYDETGVVDEDDAVASRTYDDWFNYWKMIFPHVTTKQIDDYCVQYKGSDQELNDLADIYERCKGDMDVILETLILSSYSDEERIRKLIDGLIKEGRIQSYENYTMENPQKAARRAKRALKEERLFKMEQRKKIKQSEQVDPEDGESSLISAILANREQRLKSTENLLDRLTEKYCKPTKSKAGKSGGRTGKKSAK
ncbi:hypothetical protein AHF37_01744 [Paragonimus kellicotti]|nr:hypothetical protein AHF37_01744 [Paragonimus kellicotti]